jgi:hypothetical protein
MGDEKTIRERLAHIEAKNNSLDKLINDYDGMESFHLSLIGELAKTNESIRIMGEKVDKMYPVVREVLQVKGYGNFTWKVLKWLGGLTIAIIALWDKIKHLIHYLFA